LAIPKEGRAIITLKRLDGAIRKFDRLYVTSLSYSDSEYLQVQDTFSGPFTHGFGRRPRSLTVSFAVPNNQAIEASKLARGDSDNDDPIECWREEFLRFYDFMRATRSQSASLKVQDIVYSGKVIGFQDGITAQHDGVAMGVMQMIVFDIVVPPSLREKTFFILAGQELERLSAAMAEELLAKALDRDGLTAGVIPESGETKELDIEQEAKSDATGQVESGNPNLVVDPETGEIRPAEGPSPKEEIILDGVAEDAEAAEVQTEESENLNALRLAADAAVAKYRQAEATHEAAKEVSAQALEKFNRFADLAEVDPQHRLAADSARLEHDQALAAEARALEDRIAAKQEMDAALNAYTSAQVSAGALPS